jgi:anti-anti-sigma factor
MEFYYHGVDKDVLILSADGGLDSSNAEQFVDQLGTLVESGIRKLIVDCGRLNYISSYGVGVLVRLHNKLATHGGKVKLAAVQSRILELLEIVSLTKLLHIYPNVDEARAAFRNEGRDSSRG